MLETAVTEINKEAAASMAPSTPSVQQPEDPMRAGNTLHLVRGGMENQTKTHSKCRDEGCHPKASSHTFQVSETVRNTSHQHGRHGWGQGKPSRAPWPLHLPQLISLAWHLFQYLGEVQKQAVAHPPQSR